MRCAAVFLLAGALAGQSEGLELVLREGIVLRTSRLVGDPGSGFDVELGPGRRHLAGSEVLAVFGTGAVVPAIPTLHLQGGDVLHGAVAGGDAGGNHLDLLSPVLGRVSIAVDRVAALAAPGVTTAMQLRLPDGVGEALFVRATVGFDVLTGSLHQFGEGGVRFQVQGSDAPRWFRGDDFAALRLRDAVAREDKPTATLLTRVGDRLAVTTPKWTRDGLVCRLEGGVDATLRNQDLAALVFQQDVVFLSDLAPATVTESGFDGEVVYPFRQDHNVLGGPLVCSGRSPGKGLGVHSRSRLTFQVPAGMTRFWTRVGYDDSARTLGLEPRADVAVLIDDKVVFERKDVGLGQPPLDTGLLPVRAGGTVTLVVEPGAGRDLGDRLDWLFPVFLPAGPRRP